MKSDLEKYKKDYDFEFEMEGVKKPFFRLKFPYHDATCNCEVVSMFSNEMDIKGGVYIELTDADFNRVGGPMLYYLKYSPDYATKYVSKECSTGMKFQVPVNDLENITEKWTRSKDNELPLDTGAGNDDPLKSMTIRDLCAIIWRKPLSEKDWLNRLILSNNDTTKAKSTRK